MNQCQLDTENTVAKCKKKTQIDHNNETLSMQSIQVINCIIKSILGLNYCYLTQHIYDQKTKAGGIGSSQLNQNKTEIRHRV